MSTDCRCLNRLSWIEDCWRKNGFPWYHYLKCYFQFWRCAECFYARLTDLITRS
jgi:hypothetical protein